MMPRPDERQTSLPEDPRTQYWDAKIRKWAASSYGAQRRGFLSRLRKSVDARREAAKALLRDRLPPGFTLVDLGCGAGQFALDAVQELGAGNVIGRDISPEAIRAADELRAQRAVSAEQARFEVGDLRAPIPQADVITALGFVDWLREDEIELFISQLAGRRFVFSYSEQDNSPAEIVHRIWLVWRLKMNTSGLRAAHHTRHYIFGLLRKHGIESARQVESPAMRFGRLVHNL